MSLFDELAAESKGNNRELCTVRKILDAFPADHVNDLLKALADRSITGAAISRKLTSLGFPVSGLTVQRHRRHDCSC
jgi:hypothetical protein